MYTAQSLIGPMIICYRAADHTSKLCVTPDNVQNISVLPVLAEGLRSLQDCQQQEDDLDWRKGKQGVQIKMRHQKEVMLR